MKTISEVTKETGFNFEDGQSSIQRTGKGTYKLINGTLFHAYDLGKWEVYSKIVEFQNIKSNEDTTQGTQKMQTITLHTLNFNKLDRETRSFLLANFKEADMLRVLSYLGTKKNTEMSIENTKGDLVRFLKDTALSNTLINCSDIRLETLVTEDINNISIKVLRSALNINSDTYLTRLLTTLIENRLDETFINSIICLEDKKSIIRILKGC